MDMPSHQHLRLRYGEVTHVGEKYQQIHELWQVKINLTNEIQFWNYQWRQLIQQRWHPPNREMGWERNEINVGIH